MANKRDFKKYITDMGANVCEDMLINAYSIKEIDAAAVNGSVGRVLAAVDKARDNANVYFGKGPRDFESVAVFVKAKREFFRDLYRAIMTDFIADIDAALKEFNAAVPEEVRQRNKEAAN